MKKKVVWIDLAICSLWMLAILGGRNYWNAPLQFVMVAAAVLRLSFTFTMARGEKRAWIPMALMIALGVLVASANQTLGIIRTLAVYPFHILNIKADETAMGLIAAFYALWIWFVPPVQYLIRLFRRKLTRKGLAWSDILGGILWKGRNVRVYSALMLTCIAALYSGLAMDARVCRMVCLCVPPFSFWLIWRYYGMKNDRWWVPVIAMVLFFYSQPLAGLWRIALLTASFALVVYMGCRLYRHTKLHVLSILAVLYVGVFLPSLSIGYNPYACIDYGRYGFYTHQPYNGIFYIKEGDRIGLRDRYGLLVKPKYEHIRHHERGIWFDEVELCKDGYVTLYDILNTRFERNDINGELQADVCRTLRDFTQRYECGYDDRMEVEVAEMATGRVISHVKATVKGNLFYDYTEETFLPKDTAVPKSGEFRCDTLSVPGHPSQILLSHVLDIVKDSTAIYRIGIRMAGENMPEKAMAFVLAKEIAQSEVLNGRE